MNTLSFTINSRHAVAVSSLIASSSTMAQMQSSSMPQGLVLKLFIIWILVFDVCARIDLQKQVCLVQRESSHLKQILLGIAMADHDDYLKLGPTLISIDLGTT